MKLSRQFTVFGSAVFCVVIFSLYLMLDRGHLDHPKSPRREGTFPKGQLSILQEKIDHLERLLAENNEIISNIRDSVINLSESVKDGQKNPEAINLSASELFSSASVFLAVDSEDCLFASKSGSHGSDVQMLDVYDLLPFDNPDGGVWKQGFDITYNENDWDSEPLQVFVVPHSHNDPGWLKTFDDYFRDQTQHILNNMVIKLQEDNRRKFMWSEISYFSKWWDGIDSQKKDAVKRLIKDGQFEIVTGGWVMPDEASAHYFALIDQLIEGHQWLEKNLGVKPKSGWAVDPFGHSPTMAYLLKRTGFSSMLIQRVHYSIKKHFAMQKTLEFFWRQNWDLGSGTDILCHMMPFYSYDVPHTCGPDPKICCQFDFKRLPGGRVSCPWRVPPEAIHAGNIQHRAWMILDQYRKKSKLFRTKVLLAPLGDDFRYAESSEWDQQYQNYQKLFDYMNSHPEWHVKAQFGTLSDYFEALRKESNLDEKTSNSFFPVVSGDFFTYADRDHHYWSGYFTSRPFYKRLDRVMESYLRAAEILYSMALVQSSKSEKMSVFPSVDNYKLLTEARRNLGLFQHHDAITGTSKDWVVVDYGTRLFHSVMNLKKVIIDSAHILILKDKSAYNYDTRTPFLKMDDVQSSQDFLPHKTVIKLTSQPRYLHQEKIVYIVQKRFAEGKGLEGQSLEVSNIVDIRGEYNRELAMRISSDINSQNRFYTDLNGYQIQPRLTLSKLPLQANIYPMTTMAYIQDAGFRLTLHSAQSLGVASLKNGKYKVGIEPSDEAALILHRKGFDCRFSNRDMGLLCSTTQGKVGIEPSDEAALILHRKGFDCRFSNRDMGLLCSTTQGKVGIEPSDEAALILHRKGFDCRFSNRDMGLLCSTTQGKIKVHKAFNKFRVESLTPASLSLMHSPPDARNISEINMSSMEINTFRIRLR
ncbi:alpha-mannosidase 2 [Cuculus canorus]|uniref:alpha-mannosidase 2 n=1 Tax=Cuculus canorus TaxID=55661 RepID=UPI0023AAFAA3|nr:alpha-mannosidase 2 [Cuculus canorus]